MEQLLNGRFEYEVPHLLLSETEVALTLDETGETLYESGLIDPGYYVEYIELAQALAAGDYAATATFTTYSLSETPDPIAQIQAALTLHVTDGAFYQ